MASYLHREPLGIRSVNTTAVKKWRLLGNLFWVVLVVSTCVSISGCNGCWRNESTADNEKGGGKEKPKEKRDFEFERPNIQPSDDTINLHFIKPGHWVSVTQTIKANNFDFTGEIYSASTDGRNNPIPINRTSFHMAVTRPVALPKGQSKNFETVYFVHDQVTTNPYLFTSLHMRQGGREIRSTSELSSLLKPFQFFFVVLARQPETYAHLKVMDSIRPSFDSLDEKERSRFYHVILPQTDRHVPLPSHTMAWSNIAHILWDDVDPMILAPDQQQSLVDWLHWGGQIIISGPRSLNGLKNSFLESYLPVTAANATTLDQDSLDPINNFWSLMDRNEQLKIDIISGKTIDGVKLDLTMGSSFIPHTGQLVAEKRVGRGRVVVTAFPLSHRSITNWRCYDSFLNGCLLRRPPRVYDIVPQTDEFVVRWTDRSLLREDPRLLSNLRYFSRDAAAIDSQLFRSNHLDPGYTPHAQSGVAGWNDFSAVSNAARQALKKAAGIHVPESIFVLVILGVYLVVLVPVNWGFFHAIGRVEWAWVAAPVIAICCAIVIVKLAQLDIGFARSRTEIGVMEVQGGYEHAHLTRYTALYSSLSTSYVLEFEDDSAIALPFPNNKDFQMFAGQTYQTVQLHQGRTTKLSGFSVDSNSTGTLHSEQIIDLNGTLFIKNQDVNRLTVSNSTELTFQDVGVILRTKKGDIQAGWLGNLQPQDAQRVYVKAVPKNGTILTDWEQSPMFAAGSTNTEVSLKQLFDIAQYREHLLPGDIRLIGWTDKDLPGLSIQPRASQSMVRTLVIAHLRYGDWADPRPDKNVHPQVKNRLNL